MLILLAFAIVLVPFLAFTLNWRVFDLLFVFVWLAVFRNTTRCLLLPLRRGWRGNQLKIWSVLVPFVPDRRETWPCLNSVCFIIFV